jgi:inorganic pyrophosphatase
MNPWHDVSVGDHAPELVNGIIEISAGSRAKYEMDKMTGLLRLDRVLFSAFYYPINYGFIPQTLGGDKDPLDILVLSQIEIIPRCIVTARVIGVMRMLDSGEADDKIITVCENDSSVSHIKSMAEMPAHLLLQLRQFFQEYKKLENKTVLVEDYQDEMIAKKIIVQAIADYKSKFGAPNN